MEQMEQIGKHIESLALEVVDLTPENIQAMGKMLNILSSIENECPENASVEFKELTIAIRGYVEQLTLGEIKDIGILSQAVKSLQDIFRNMERGENAGYDQFREIIERLKKGSSAEPGEAKEKSKDKDSCLIEKASEPERSLSPEDIDLLQDFVSESLEALSTVEVNLVGLEQNPNDTEIINSIFRSFHTIKGVSGFLNLNKINKLAHHCENLLDRARSGELVIDENVTDFILDAVDVLEKMIESIQEGVKAGRVSEGDINVKPIIGRIESIPQATEQTGQKPLGEILVQEGVVDQVDVDHALDEQEKGENKKLGRILVEKGAIRAKDLADALHKQRKSGGKNIDLQVKVDTRKLDTLVDMIGELVITQSMLRQNKTIVSSADQKLFQTMSQLNQITSTLQKTAMSMRMVPIRATFQKMVRLVRDLAKNSGKRVRLEMSGGDTEIDRNVVDELYEPMVHMVRNSVDHGIEPPEARQAAGKDPEGVVWLRAYHRSGNIVIEIEDDGRGLDSDRILEKAKEKGLIDQDTELSDSDIYNLIFQPGFSTAREVTDISGRGVGMDVVKKSIEKLRGRVDIESVAGKGSKFIIRLPLTLAIIDGMLVRVGKERYIIPTLSILESLRPDRTKYTSVHGRREIIRVRDKLMPLVRFEEIFHVSCDSKDPWDGLVVAVEQDGRQFCLLVDEVLGKEEVVIKSLGSSLMDAKGFAGGAILGDGRVALILDMAELCQLSGAGLV